MCSSADEVFPAGEASKGAIIFRHRCAECHSIKEVRSLAVFYPSIPICFLRSLSPLCSSEWGLVLVNTCPWYWATLWYLGLRGVWICGLIICQTSHTIGGHSETVPCYMCMQRVTLVTLEWPGHGATSMLVFMDIITVVSGLIVSSGRSASWNTLCNLVGGLSTDLYVLQFSVACWGYGIYLTWPEWPSTFLASV